MLRDYADRPYIPQSSSLAKDIFTVGIILTLAGGLYSAIQYSKPTKETTIETIVLTKEEKTLGLLPSDFENCIDNAITQY